MGLLSRRRPNVEKLKQRGDLHGLRCTLRHEEPFVDADGEEWDAGVEIRVEAAGALASFYGQEVVGALASALEDAYPAVRLAAVEGLARLRAPAVAEHLLEGFVQWDDPPDGEARELARLTLTELHLEGLPNALVHKLLASSASSADPRHREVLEAFLDADPRGSAAAGSVVEQLVDALQSPRDEAHEELAAQMLSWISPRAADALVAALASPEPSTAVALAAGWAGDPRAVSPLIALLAHGEPSKRRAAATALGRLSDSRAVASLLACTQDADQGVREAASEALTTMGVAAVIFGVASLLRGEGSLLDQVEHVALPSVGEPSPDQRSVAELTDRPAEHEPREGEPAERALRDGE